MVSEPQLQDLTCFLTIWDKTLYLFNNSDDWDFEVVSERYVMKKQSSLSLVLSRGVCGYGG